MFFRKAAQHANKIPTFTKRFLKANETGAIYGASLGLGGGVLASPTMFYDHAVNGKSKTCTGMYLDGMKGAAEGVLVSTALGAAIGSAGVSIPLALAYEAYYRETNNEPSSIKPK